MFRFSCFIENSKEAREWLELIEIRIIGGTYGNTLMVVDGKAMCFELEGKIGSNFQDATNCQGNLDLFKALTAVRDDSDYMQEFYSTGWCDNKGNPLPDKWILCDQKTLEHFGWVNNSPNSYKSHLWHKATKEELIEKFKI